MSEMKFRYFDMEQNSINTRGKYIAFVAINTFLYGNKIWKADPGYNDFCKIRFSQHIFQKLWSFFMTILFLLVTKYTIVSRRKVIKSKLSMHRTEVFLLSLPTTRFSSLITFFLLFIQKSNLSIKLYLKCYLRFLFIHSRDRRQ